MRIGIMAGASSGPDATLDALVELAADVERRGFSSLWMAQFFGMDALTPDAESKERTFAFLVSRAARTGSA